MVMGFWLYIWIRRKSVKRKIQQFVSGIGGSLFTTFIKISINGLDIKKIIFAETSLISLPIFQFF